MRPAVSDRVVVFAGVIGVPSAVMPLVASDARVWLSRSGIKDVAPDAIALLNPLAVSRQAQDGSIAAAGMR